MEILKSKRFKNRRYVGSPGCRQSGAIDMGGVLITPVKKDFDRLDATAVEGIYREVSLEGKTLEKALNALHMDQSTSS